MKPESMEIANRIAEYISDDLPPEICIPDGIELGTVLWEAIAELKELRAENEKLRALIKTIDAQSIATTEPNYVAVPASVIADAVRACEQKGDKS